MRAIAALALGATGVGREVVKQATRYEEYIVLARACGVSGERAKAIFEEEALKPNGYNGDGLTRAKLRIASGEQGAA